jgi:hypothetical protein
MASQHRSFPPMTEREIPQLHEASFTDEVFERSKSTSLRAFNRKYVVIG